MEAWSVSTGLPQISPMTLCPGRSQAIMQSPLETSQTTCRECLPRACSERTDHGTATSFQVGLTRISQDTSFSLSYYTKKYSATSLNTHHFYQTASWRLPTTLTKGTRHIMFDTIAQSLGKADPSDCQSSLRQQSLKVRNGTLHEETSLLSLVK